MSNNPSETIQSNAVTSHKVAPLAISSGGKNSTNKQFHEMNTKIAMLGAQAKSAAKYDPDVNAYTTKPMILRDGVVVDGFCSDYPIPVSLAVVGTLLFVYGFVAK